MVIALMYIQTTPRICFKFSTLTATFYAPSGCINGICIAPNHCSCAANWGGAQCNIGKKTHTCNSHVNRICFLPR